jgi:hypothetical protein
MFAIFYSSRSQKQNPAHVFAETRRRLAADQPAGDSELLQEADLVDVSTNGSHYRVLSVVLILVTCSASEPIGANSLGFQHSLVQVQKKTKSQFDNVINKAKAKIELLKVNCLFCCCLSSVSHVVAVQVKLLTMRKKPLLVLSKRSDDE